MKTKHKIALASMAYKGVSTVRRLYGASDQATVVRRGIRYNLDLSEGIDFAIYLQGQFEPKTAKCYEKHVQIGHCVLDIGANIGAHTLNLARLVGETGRVFAFEPTKFAFSKLLHNLKINPDLAARVEAHQCFLGPTQSVAAPAAIYSSWPLTRSEDDLHNEHLGAPKSTEGAKTDSVDRFLTERGNPSVDCVKLDVDGHECAVLEGAQQMMNRDRPIFVMEIAPYVLSEHGASLGKLLDYFIPLGYRFYREDNGDLLPDTAKKLATQIGDGASWNVVARAAG